MDRRDDLGDERLDERPAASGTLCRICCAKVAGARELERRPPPPPAPELVDELLREAVRAQRPGSSFVSESARSVPAMVSPIVPPICWKNVRLAVALPTCRGSTLFWTSAAKRANDGPTPSPVTTIQTHRIGSVRVGPQVRHQEQPAGEDDHRAEDDRPCSGRSWPRSGPETVAPTISAKTSGRRFRPDSVAPMPRTTWNHCGRKTIAPKKPKAARNIDETEIETVRIRKSWGRMIGSTARDSHQMKTPAMTSPSDDQPADPGIGPLERALVAQAEEDRDERGREQARADVVDVPPALAGS